MTLAERSGLILPLGAWVLRTACEQLRTWRADETGWASGLSVSVNVAAAQLAHPGLHDEFLTCVDTNDPDPGDVALEITEAAVMQDVELAGRVVERLRGQGVRVSLDDFGTGYSSLSHLTTLPVDELQIDPSFVTRLASSPRTRDVVDAVLKLSRALDVTVTAEGVETSAQAAALASLGVDRLPGYLFGRPVPAQDIARRGAASAAAVPSPRRPPAGAASKRQAATP